MRRSRPMASLAAHPILRRLQPDERAGGMTGKASVDARFRVADFVQQSRRLGQVGWLQRPMPWGGAKRAQLRVVSEVVFQIELCVALAHKRHGLLARAKGPFHRDGQHVGAIVDAQVEWAKAVTKATRPPSLGAGQRPSRS